MSVLVGERREQAGRKKEGGMECLEFGWGLGKWRNPDAGTRRKPDQEIGAKRPSLMFVLQDNQS